MATNFKKAAKVPYPKKTPGLARFPHVSPPKQPPLKTRIYTKGTLREDPMEFSDFGFGRTGFESPPMLGLGERRAR